MNIIKKVMNMVLDSVSNDNDPRVLTGKGTGFEITAEDGSKFVVLDNDEIVPISEVIQYL